MLVLSPNSPVSSGESLLEGLTHEVALALTKEHGDAKITMLDYGQYGLAR